MISAVLITKNEEKNIARCLKSIDWVDEIVILDSGSIDETLEIAKKFKAKIYTTKWLGFGKTKQLAVSHALNKWVLSIDADEEVSDELKTEIQNILAKNVSKNIFAYRIKRSSFYLNRLIKYSGWQKDYPVRLFNKEKCNFNDEVVHESVTVCQKNLSQIESKLFHYPYHSISHHVKKIDHYTTLGADKLFQKGQKSTIYFAILSSFAKFFKMYIIKMGFLDGKEGFVLCTLSSYSNFLKYIKLWAKSSRL